MRQIQFAARTRLVPDPLVEISSPVVSGVSDGSLAAQPVALLQVEGVLSVRVVAGPQLLGCQEGLLIEDAQQLALLLRSRRLGHLQRTQKVKGGPNA